MERKALAAPITLGPSESLKVILTVQDGKTAKRPHQAFLLLKDADTGLDISYPFSVKESGKAKLEMVRSVTSFCLETPLTIDRLTKTSLSSSSDLRSQWKRTWSSGRLDHPRATRIVSSY